MKVFIATPTADGSVKVRYMTSILETLLDLQGHGIDCRFDTLDGVTVVRARNILASRFFAESAYTHLFFVDSDMQFAGSLCRRMLALDKPVVGAACTKKTLDLDVLRRHWGGDLSFDDALAIAHQYTLRLPPGPLHISDGVCQVDGFGFGVALIRRDALERMVSMGAARLVRNDANTRADGLPHGLYNFFDQLPSPHGDLLSEDWSFCQRWKEQCGGELWAIVDADIGHIGEMRYGQPYVRKLKHGLA